LNIDLVRFKWKFQETCILVFSIWSVVRLKNLDLQNWYKKWSDAKWNGSFICTTFFSFFSNNNMQSCCWMLVLHLDIYNYNTKEWKLFHCVVCVCTKHLAIVGHVNNSSALLVQPFLFSIPPLCQRMPAFELLEFVARSVHTHTHRHTTKNKCETTFYSRFDESL
jgi:hypothetical protein